MSAREKSREVKMRLARAKKRSLNKQACHVNSETVAESRTVVNSEENQWGFINWTTLIFTNYGDFFFTHITIVLNDQALQTSRG